METEDPAELKRTIAKLQQELELHNSKSRRLVTAMTLKLQEKEKEIVSLRVLRDQQLRQVLSQLLAFQGGLTLERKRIRAALHTKDSLVQDLQEEIIKLRAENKRLLIEKAKSTNGISQGQKDDKEEEPDDDAPPPSPSSLSNGDAQNKEKRPPRPSLPPKPKLKPKPADAPKQQGEKKALKSGLKSMNGVSKEVKRSQRTVRFNLDCDYRYDSDGSDMTECDTSRPVSILDTISRLLDRDKDSSPTKGSPDTDNSQENISLDLQPLKTEKPQVRKIAEKFENCNGHGESAEEESSSPKIEKVNGEVNGSPKRQGEKLQSILKSSKSDSEIMKSCKKANLKKQMSDADVRQTNGVVVVSPRSDSELDSSNESLSSLDSPGLSSSTSPHKSTDGALNSSNSVSSRRKGRSTRTRNDILKDVSDHMVRQNFEEFKLEIVEEDEENKRREEKEKNQENKRKDGDGAESGNEQTGFESDYRKLFYFNGSYEKFLEATGLSQKSLASPVRPMSNHRSVLKPKDVKNRSKIRAALNIPEPKDTNGLVKYWTEPFL